MIVRRDRIIPRHRSPVSFLVGVICVIALWGAPVKAQEAEGEAGASEAKTEAVQPAPEGDPKAAITIKEPDIPVEELQLLVRPMTLTELQNEAAGWQMLLQAKSKEISDAEIAVKRQNRSITKQKEASDALDQAKKALDEAEKGQKTAAPGSPEYEAATKKVEEAKAQLKKAQESVKEATEAKQDIKDDKALRTALKAAEKTGQIDQAQKLLDELKKGREKLVSGTPAYETATQQIDKLEVAIKALEDAKKAEKSATVDTPAYQEAKQKAEQASQELEKVQQEVGGSGKTGGSTTEQSTNNQLDATANTLEGTKIQENAASPGTPDAASSPANLNQKGQQLEKAADKLQQNAQAESDLKNQLLVNVTELQSARTAVIDRFNAVLSELERKGGDAKAYRNYIKAVSFVEVDVKDTEGTGVRLLSWFKSEEGGLRWAANVGKFVGIIVVAAIISQILGMILNKILKMSGTSKLLRQFIIILIKRGGILIGVLVALTALEVSLGPVLALLGGASFVLAFALQSNLGNLASGIMIMLYKPFDVGDEVQIGDVWGFVDSISLAGTRILSLTNQLVTIPNNAVWESVITNNTGADLLGIEVKFQVGYEVPLPELREILLDLCRNSSLILDDPQPIILPLEFRDSAIHMLLLAFTKTDNRWTVRWELPALVQARLAKEEIDMVDYAEVNLYYPSGKPMPSDIPEKQLAEALSSHPELSKEIK